MQPSKNYKGEGVMLAGTPRNQELKIVGRPGFVVEQEGDELVVDVGANTYRVKIEDLLTK